MSWIEKLFTTYENNLIHIGDKNDVVPLLPICHAIQNAQINIVIDVDGNFLRANVIPKNNARTIIPATEESAGRTRGYVPHPLVDKLQYLAGDYPKFGGEKPSEFEKYCSNLGSWCNSQYGDPKIKSVLAYLKKGELIQDLVNTKIFYTNEKGKLLEKWNGKKTEVPEIFKVVQNGGQIETFIRFSVEIPGDPQSELQTDKTIWENWANYYKTIESSKGLCYVSGEYTAMAKNHPKRIRNPKDGAKLISSNDLDGLTFLGRFTTPDETYGIGFEISQKAHSALRWLISRQGRQNGDQTIVSWAVSGAPIPDFCSDTASLFSEANIERVDTTTGYTGQEIGIQLSKLIAGYTQKLGNTDDIVILVLDSATPGRMSITFYRELTGSELLERVLAWHNQCSWLQHFEKEKVFVGAPAPADIAEAAYGPKIREDNKKILLKSTVERLLPCIIDGVQIPNDLVESCVRRASARHGSKNGANESRREYWEWEKTLGIACATYRKQFIERGYTMALDKARKTRDYLYGRLLALAEQLEDRALFVAGEKRDTNAAKLMQRFAERPYSTWLTIETSLTPYKTRLRVNRPGFLHNIETQIDEIVASFSEDDYLSDKRLTGEFLLGYHCQRAYKEPSNQSNDISEKEIIEVEK